MIHRTSRRSVLRLGAAGAVTALAGCDGAVRFLGGEFDGLPDDISLAAGADVGPDFHLLARATYGPRPGDLDNLKRLGRDAWLEEQLHPERIDDSVLDFRIASECEYALAVPHDLESVLDRDIEEHLQRATLLRAVHSRRQLAAVMAGFWHDHFSIDIGKRGCMETKPLDVRRVHVGDPLGRFRDLVRASALSPAMLIYLDGKDNKRETKDEAPNENYARELLELHTLGVHGGYTQRDVMEAARCLTGWTYENKDQFGDAMAYVTGAVLFDGKHKKRDPFRSNHAFFRKHWHDDGEKVVLGTVIPAGGGEKDLDDLLEIVCRHASTSRHLAWKLCRRFVADPPPESLVDSTAHVFYRTDGEIRSVLRHILTSEEFARSTGRKLKRPFRFVVSALRAVGVECRAGRGEQEALERLGHVPHHYPTPDGYPDEPEPWTGTLLWRWNFALRLCAGRLDKTKPDLADLARRAGLDPDSDSPADLAPLFFGRRATPAERRTVDEYVANGNGAARAEGVALLLAAPAFQVY